MRYQARSTTDRESYLRNPPQLMKSILFGFTLGEDETELSSQLSPTASFGATALFQSACAKIYRLSSTEKASARTTSDIRRIFMAPVYNISKCKKSGADSRYTLKREKKR